MYAQERFAATLHRGFPAVRDRLMGNVFIQPTRGDAIVEAARMKAALPPSVYSADSEDKPIVLVACSGQKLDHAAPAQDLYTSDLFKKARAWAEKFGGRWYILSAKHGVVPPGQIIKPYDETLNDKTGHERACWNALVRAQFGEPSCGVVVLAGEKYRGWLSGIPHDVPMAGLGIGQQKAWLKSQVDAGKAPATIPVLPGKYNDKSQAWRAGYHGAKGDSPDHKAGAAQAAKDNAKTTGNASMNQQALTEAKTMVADLSTAATINELDALYVNWIGYSAIEDDPLQTAEQLRGDLRDYIKEFCFSTGIDCEVAGLVDVPDAATFIAECKASIESLNGEILKAIDYRDFTKADRLDRQRTALYKSIAKAKADAKTYVLHGRRFGIVAEFPDTDAGTRAANAFMTANPDTGLLAAAEGRIIVAKLADKGRAA